MFTIMNQTKKSSSFVRWFRNKRLQTKIFIVVFLVMILFIATLSFVLVQMNSEIKALESLIDVDLKIEEHTLELHIIGGEINAVIQEYIITPDAEVLVEFEDVKEELASEIATLTPLFASLPQDERDILEEPVLGIATGVEEIVDIAEAEEGIFFLVQEKVEHDEHFEIEAEELSDYILEYEHLTESQANAGEIVDVIFELQTALWIGISRTFLYEMSYTDEFKSHAKYLFGLNNSTTGLAEHVTEHQPLHEYSTELRTLVSGNTTLEEGVDEIAAMLFEMKVDVKDIISIMTELETNINLMTHTVHEMEETVTEIIQLIDHHILEEEDVIEQQQQDTIAEVIVITIIVVLISIFVTLWIANLTTKPVIQLAMISERISDGNLTVEDDEVFEASDDEIGQLTKYFQQMTDQLRSIVGSTQESVGILSTASEDLFSGAEEINASSEEVASTSQAMSNGATSQTEMIAEVNEDIQKTQKMVNDIIKKIQENTQDVAQIALQTNILALNAGIEASRAGDYGRGFMVVAENVRKLSDQSKTASEEIAMVADEIAENLQASFSKITHSMGNIVSVSEETAASAEEVAAAAEEMTATVEELSSSASQLTTTAEESAAMIGQFTFDEKEVKSAK